MTRRELLLVLAGSACSGGPGGTRDPKKPAPPVSFARHYLTAVLEPSPLSTHDDVLVHRTASKLSWWNTLAMELVGETAVQGAAAATFLPDGTLAVLANDVVHRATRERTLATYEITPPRDVWRRPPVLLRTAAADTLYILDDDDLSLMRFTGTALEQVAALAFPGRHGPDRGQAFSLDDGRVVTHGEGLVVLAPGAQLRSHPTHRLAKHLAPATSDRLWYSYEGSAWGLHRLVLAAIAAPAEDIVALDLAPARIVHLASHADAVALVLVTKEARWFVAVVDESGRERWRVELPAKHTRGFELAAVTAITMTKHRVILRGFDEGLHAWDAADGTAIL